MIAPRRIRDAEDGFTMIEVLVAMLLSIITVGALALLLVHANDSSLGSQRQVNLLSVAQQQIERVRQTVTRYGFGALAMNAYPAAEQAPLDALDPFDPNHFVTNNNTSSAAFQIEQNYNYTSYGQISSAPGNGEPLIIDASAGRITPQQTSVSAGTGTATVFTYVTQASVGANSSLTCSPSCANDARRVTVAVKLDLPPGQANGRTDLGPSHPTYASTIITSPVPSNQPNSADGLRVGLNIL